MLAKRKLYERNHILPRNIGIRTIKRQSAKCRKMNHQKQKNTAFADSKWMKTKSSGSKFGIKMNYIIRKERSEKFFSIRWSFSKVPFCESKEKMADCHGFDEKTDSVLLCIRKERMSQTFFS